MKDFGFIGVGAAGNKLVDCFVKSGFKGIAVNTALQDLNSLENIQSDNRIYTKINDTGGAGKDIEKGEYAIKKYKNKIKEYLKLVFENEYVFVCMGLGGGTGTLGGVQVSRILAEVGVEHGLITTIPANNEDSIAMINSVIGLEMIERARQKFKSTLKSIILVNNEYLKKYIFNKSNVSYEKLWDRANQYIVNSFIKMYEFTMESGKQNIDTTDYMKMFQYRGYMMFAQGKIGINNVSDDVLAKKVREYWQNPIFCVGDIRDALGLIVIVNRKKDDSGIKIDRLNSMIKEYYKSIHYVSGVYSVNQKISWLDKITDVLRSKEEGEIEIHTMISGIPFPEDIFERLNGIAKKEGRGIINKKR